MSLRLRQAGHCRRYRLRKQVVEPVFGQIKQARGFRPFLLRGLSQVAGEWSMVCSVHNVLNLAGARGMSVSQPGAITPHALPRRPHDTARIYQATTLPLVAHPRPLLGQAPRVTASTSPIRHTYTYILTGVLTAYESLEISL